MSSTKSLVLGCCEAPELAGPPGDPFLPMDDHYLHLVPTGYYAKLKNIIMIWGITCAFPEKNIAKLKKTTCGIKIAGCDLQCSRIGWRDFLVLPCNCEEEAWFQTFIFPSTDPLVHKPFPSIRSNVPMMVECSNLILRIHFFDLERMV